MVDTKQLIEELSAKAAPVKMVRPTTHIARLLVGLGVYAAIIQSWLLGLRADLDIQLERPLFVIELALLVGVILCAIVAAVYTMYPDMQQKRRIISLPYICVAILLLLLFAQLWMPIDPRMVLADERSHTIECTLYIGFSSMLPAWALFVYLQSGRSVVPLQTGIFIVLAATGLGALTLRMHEAIDPASHQLIWHYLPNLAFAALGAWVGKLTLRW